MAQETRVAWIDAGRALAAALVVAFHVLYELAPSADLRPIGFFGASLFFILSGYSLASRYQDTVSFSFDWLKRRWIRIAAVYYPALVAVYALFPTQVTHAGPFAVVTHFLFIDFLFPDTEYAIISPAWFIIPLMAFYVAFPYLNRLVRWSRWVVTAAFIITAIFRISAGPAVYTSFSPLFFLAEFCFGIGIARGQKMPAYASAIISLLPNPLMIAPFAIFAVLSVLDFRLLGPALAAIGAHSLEIFLLHEALMKAALGRWSFYGEGVAVSVAATVGAFFLVLAASSELSRRFLKH
jgi:peptidoglycan/LPS O-acetylase OafA/YrhL